MEEKLTSTLQMLNLNQQDSWRSNFNGKDQLNTVFHEICKDHVKYSDLFKALYEDKSSQNQLRCDMYLQLYYKFATALTKEISSIPNFLQSTTFPYAPDITYSSNDTSRRMFKKLHLEEKECLITYIAANKEINGKSNTADDPVVISKSSQILSNDFFTVGTRLEDFFYTHVQILSPEQLLYSEDTGLIKNTAKHHKYLFRESSRHFLSVLLRAANEHTSPYTKPALSGLSAKEVKGFFLPLFYAYTQKTVGPKFSKIPFFERLLFLRNFEYIYRPSLFAAALRYWNDAFLSKEKTNALLHLNISLTLLYKLDQCPFDSARLLLFDSLIKSADPHSDFIQISNEIDRCCIVLQNIYDNLKDCLFKEYSSNISVSENVTKSPDKQILKAHDVLMHNLEVSADFSWSILETAAARTETLKQNLKKRNPKYSEESARTKEEFDNYNSVLFKAFSEDYNKAFFPIEYLDSYIMFYLIRDFYNPTHFGFETSNKIRTDNDPYLNYRLHSIYPDQ